MDSVQGKQILVIDASHDFLIIAEAALSAFGGQVLKAASGYDGLRQFFFHQPDLVILDLMMPNMSGWEVCQRIRQVSEVPIIILTALNSAQDTVDGLDCGADDVLIKPVSPSVLRAHVRAILRRAYSYRLPKPTATHTYLDDHLQIDVTKRTVRIQGEPVKLSALENKLLAFLFRHAGQVLTFERILEQVWGQGYQDSIQYVHNYVSRLRQKLEPDPGRPIYLLTEHGVGYRFEPHESARTEQVA